MGVPSAVTPLKSVSVVFILFLGFQWVCSDLPGLGVLHHPAHPEQTAITLFIVPLPLCDCLLFIIQLWKGMRKNNPLTP